MNLLPNVKVLVVDDHPLVRDGISAIIDYQDDLEVVGQAANAAEAIAPFESLAPDVTLVDLGLPDMDGIELIRILRAKSATARFIVVTAEAGGGEIAKALGAGAHAYLFKNGPFAELFTAIREVPTGRCFQSEAVGRPADSVVARQELMTGDAEDLKWRGPGHFNSQIADKKGVAEVTVTSRVKNMLLLVFDSRTTNGLVPRSPRTG
jgi:two-component system, NarL family, response regulator